MLKSRYAWPSRNICARPAIKLWSRKAPWTLLNSPAIIPDRSTFSVTDVVMPEIRGPELARRVQELYPNIHVIYMPGYAEGGMDRAIPPKAAFLQKPFRFATLPEQLRLLLRRA
jgi:FixJ family two-component response regulator